MTNASRWALMIDPQLQGIKWILNREAANGLVVIQQSQPKYIDKVGAGCQEGTVCWWQSRQAWAGQAGWAVRACGTRCPTLHRLQPALPRPVPPHELRPLAARCR
jgi:hypothetical protein